MSLPAKYTNPETYFRSCTDFLKSYAWIYQTANTCFLKAGTLERLSVEEMDYFNHVTTEELNTFPLVKSKSVRKAPKSLLEFRSHLKDLTPDEAFQEASTLVPPKLSTFKKISCKKQHEISQLAQLVKHECDNNEFLIDFGAGLGYLSESLYQRNTGYRILGLEADSQRVQTACRRQQENLPEASAKVVVYKQHLIAESSADFIAKCAQEMLCAGSGRLEEAEPRWSIVGLHACADLSVTSMRLFFDMSQVRRLITMPCCYHKLEVLQEQGFRNFPLSRSLQSAVAFDDGDDAGQFNSHLYFNRPFLRLACQQTLARWRCCNAEQHATHGLQMWQRALAEAILGETEKVVKRKCKQEVDGLDNADVTFEGLCTAYELRSKIDNQALSWQTHHKCKFEELARKYPSGPKLAEGLTCLQTSMQKLCENIVLYDRLCYMQEVAAAKDLQISARFIKLMDEELSPRCYALVAEKLYCQVN